MAGNRFVGLEMPDLPTVSLPVDNENLTLLSIATGSLVHMLQLAELDRLVFEKSECWKDAVSEALPYKVNDFINYLQYYKATAKHALRQIDALPQEFLDASPTFHHASPLAPLKTFRHVRAQIASMAFNLLEGIQNLASITRKEPTDLEKVPAVSLREVRCWLQLNTKALRAPFEDPGISEPDIKNLLDKFKPILDPDQKIITDEYNGTDNTIHFEVSKASQKLRASKNRTIGNLTPGIWFICSGIGFEKGLPYIIHRIFTIGATKERIIHWSSAYDLRLEVRNIHVGDNDKTRWSEAYALLELYDNDLANLQVNRTDGRRHLQHHVLNVPGGPVLGPDITALAQRASPHALRSVHHHVGMSYSLGSKEGKDIGCCYGCKSTSRYAEPGLADDIEKAAGNMNFESRNESWSCAEVLSSWYCESAEGIEIVRKESENDKGTAAKGRNV